MEETFVIVGAGLAGAKAAETLRAEGFGGQVVLVGDEPQRPYERPPLSKGYLLGSQTRDKAFVHDPWWYADNKVDLRLACPATGLNTHEHTVTLDGGEVLDYDKLLIATGCAPRRLDVLGADLRGVRYMRTLSDADALRAMVADGIRVVVVGAGWVGMEVAAGARARGADVTVVELDHLPLRRVLGDEVGAYFADLHSAHGVDFRFESAVHAFQGAGGQLASVALADGTELSADVAVIGIGVRPRTSLARAGGLAVDNGILVDSGLRTSAPDVFACGDVANMASNLLGHRIRVDHWANALNGGKAAALAMLGRPVSYDRVPYFYTDQFGVGMEYSGYAGPGRYDDVVFRGEPSVTDGFMAFWLSHGCVLAGMNVNVRDVTDDVQALVRAGHAGVPVDRDALTDPARPLGSLLP